MQDGYTFLSNISLNQEDFNVNNTENKSGKLCYYTDLDVWTGSVTCIMWFFLTDLGEHKVILGFPWFMGMQPKIDWAREWIDHTQLSIIIRTPDAKKAIFMCKPWTQNIPREIQKDQYFAGWVTFHPEPEEVIQGVPNEYKCHTKVFSEQKSQCLSKHTIWDHAIELVPDAPCTLPGRLLPLTQEEIAEVHKFVAEHLKCSTITES